MIVYAESNFILECALAQEQHVSCNALLAHAEASHIDLILPSFSIAEPLHTVGRRTLERRDLSVRLSTEFQQLSRSLNFAKEVDTLRDVTGFLVRTGERELDGLRKILERVVRTSILIPLDEAAVTRSFAVELDHGLHLPDAIVLASVLNDLDTRAPKEAIFLNRNVKDFDDPDIIALLKAGNCRLIPSFNDALAFIDSRFGKTTG